MGAQIGRIVQKVSLPETSSHRPAIAIYEGRLFIAWKGSGNDNLNILCSQNLSLGVMPSFDSGKTHTSPETSDDAPALAVHRGILYIAWKGSGNDNLSVAQVDVTDLGNGELQINGIGEKIINTVAS
jgi:hypothetical protein